MKKGRPWEHGSLSSAAALIWWQVQSLQNHSCCCWKVPSPCLDEAAFSGQGLWSAKGCLVLRESIPVPLGVGKEKGWGALLGSEGTSSLKIQLLTRKNVDTAALPGCLWSSKAPGSRAGCRMCRIREGTRQRSANPESLSSPLRTPEKLLLFPSLPFPW